MTLHKGDIVLLPFSFTDLRATKVRPAVVLWVDTTKYDVTSYFISSQNVTMSSPEEFLLDPSDSDFEIIKLRVASKGRVTRIVTIEQRLITKRIGKVSDAYIQQLNSLLPERVATLIAIK